MKNCNEKMQTRLYIYPYSIKQIKIVQDNNITFFINYFVTLQARQLTYSSILQFQRRSFFVNSYRNQSAKAEIYSALYYEDLRIYDEIATNCYRQMTIPFFTHKIQLCQR